MEAFVLKLAQLVLIFLAVVKADMTFYAVGVGQGESCIIQCPNQKDLVIVDMGATGPKYVTHEYIRYLLKEKFHAAESGKRIHVLVTHSHVDHYNYIDKVFDRYLLPNVQEVILGGRYEDYKDMQIRNWLEDNIRNLYSINNQEKCFGNSDCALTPTWTRYAGCTTTLTTGMNKAIYETCRVIDSQNKQVCQDIRISTNGKTDKTSYEDVPKKYVNENSKRITKSPFLCNA